MWGWREDAADVREEQDKEGRDKWEGLVV